MGEALLISSSDTTNRVMPGPEPCGTRLALSRNVTDARSVSQEARAAYDLAVERMDVDHVDRASALMAAGQVSGAERALPEHIDQHKCM